MTAHDLVCVECGRSTPASVMSIRCRSCEGPLAVRYLDRAVPDSPRWPMEVSAMPSRGEGRTPVVELNVLAAELGLGRLRAKLEFLAPTGSFKDRGSVLLTGMARAAGIRAFVEDSSGNAGASLAAYAAVGDLTAHVFVPATAAAGKRDQIRVFGATLHLVEGPRQAVTDAASAFAEQHGLPWLSHNLSPYFSEGMKPFAWEVAGTGAVPRHLVFPVGNGSLLIGAALGFDEAKQAGRLDGAPRLHAVQSVSVAPVAYAFEGREWREEATRSTVAGGIAVSRPPRLRQIVRAVERTGGTALAVDEDAILRWHARLATAEGLFVEPTSAAALAGVEALLARGVVAPGEDVMMPLTGSGLKDLRST